MKKEQPGPWVVRLTDERGKDYMVSPDIWHSDIRFARRFLIRRAAAKQAAVYLKHYPEKWGSVRVIRLVKKATPCA